jgi:hypothetical protein
MICMYCTTVIDMEKHKYEATQAMLSADTCCEQAMLLDRSQGIKSGAGEFVVSRPHYDSGCRRGNS